MITERTLKIWRRNALREINSLKGVDRIGEATVERRELSSKILRMTQELLDNYLLQKEQGKRKEQK